MAAAGLRPDGLIVATPNALHVEHGLAAVAAGIPALVEKPLAADVGSATRLVEAAERAGVPLLVGHHRRHNPLIREAKAIVDSGRLGRLVAVHAFFWLLKPDPYFDVAWRREPGGGPILINLIHDVDLLRHLCGEIVAVRALASSAVRGHEVEDTAAVLLRFAGGALGTASISDAVAAPWSWEHTAGETAAYPHAGGNFCFLGGTRGSLALPSLELWSYPGARGWWEPFRLERAVAAREDPLRLQIRNFCRVIRGEEAPLVSGREGLRTLAVVEAVREAARSGLEVAVS
jgi:predicted dehydrogenase